MSEQNILDGGQPVEQPTEAAPATGAILDGGQPAAPAAFEFPEAFRVMAGEAVDVNASAAKLAEAYQARAAFGAIPGADESYNAPEGLEQWDEIKDLDVVKSFQEEAKKLGFTHEQFAFALDQITKAEYDGRVYQLDQDRAANETALRDEWKDPASYDLNIKNANNAVSALVAPAERADFLAKYGSDSKIIKMLARIGGELSEDQAIGLLEPIPTGEDIKSLMLSEAYANSKHPDHQTVFAKVQRHYAKTYGTQPTL